MALKRGWEMREYCDIVDWAPQGSSEGTREKTDDRYWTSDNCRLLKISFGLTEISRMLHDQDILKVMTINKWATIHA